MNSENKIRGRNLNTSTILKYLILNENKIKTSKRKMIISKAKIKLNIIRYNLRVPSNRVAIVSRKVF